MFDHEISMLLRFRFTNHRSFRDEQELSLIAGPFTDHPEVAHKVAGLREGILPVAAVYGANASGKTNVLRALEWMAVAVRSSHKDWPPDGAIPREPFVGAEAVPSRFIADLMLYGTRYQYGFVVDSEVVLEEWLLAYPNGKKQTWFSRKAGRAMTFSAKMPGENKAIEKLTRRNSLFLSTAAQNNHRMLLPVYVWFADIRFIQGQHRNEPGATIRLCRRDHSRKAITRLMAVADLGITEIKIQEEPVSASKQFVQALRSIPEFADLLSPRTQVQLFRRVAEGTVPFPIEEESDGTKAYFALIGPVTNALNSGTALCIDELDASLHSLLAAQLIKLFNDPSSNPRGAQLIFNTHDTNLLSAGILRRDQIWFTEKNSDASTVLYPLSDFKPRKQENLESGYLQGRYGAIPFLNPDAFLRSLEAGNGKK